MSDYKQFHSPRFIIAYSNQDILHLITTFCYIFYIYIYYLETCLMNKNDSYHQTR